MANGGRTFVSQKELDIIKELKENQKIQAEIEKERVETQKQEIQNIRDMKEAYELTGDESLRLTESMKQRLSEYDKEEGSVARLKEAKTFSSSLDKTLLKNQKSLNKLKSKDATLAKGALDSLIKSREENDLTQEQFEDQVSILEQIAAGTATAAELQSKIKDLGGETSEAFADYLESQQQSLATSEFSKKAMGEFDSIIGGLGGKIKGFITNPLTAATAVLLTFNATQESIGKQFGAIGVTEFRRELSGASAQFAELGLSADEAQQTVSDLANQFGLGVDESAELSENVSELAVSTGATLQDTTKLVGLFTQTQGLTGDQAANLLASTTALANANNVAPDKILADVAQSTEFFAQFADEGGENILRAAVQARKLGLNLQAVEKITTGLLDFQTSLNAENEASVLIGRKLNFQKARELALANDIEGATAAVVEQLGSAEEFNKLNAIQRKALADAAGVEVSELSKIVNKEKEALTLQGALSKQEIKPIPEEVLTNTAQLIGNLQSIGIVLAEVLGPPLNMVVGVFSFLAEGLGVITGLIEDNTLLFAGLTTVILAVIAVTKKKMIMDKKAALVALAKKAFEGGFGGPVGIALSIAAALAGAAIINRIATMDDGHMKPDGTFVSSPKGTVKLNDMDSAVFGTDLGGGSGGGTDTSRMEQKQDKQNELLTGMLNTLDGALAGPKPALARAMGGAVTDGIDGMA